VSYKVENLWPFIFAIFSIVPIDSYSQYLKQRSSGQNNIQPSTQISIWKRRNSIYGTPGYELKTQHIAFPGPFSLTNLILVDKLAGNEFKVINGKLTNSKFYWIDSSKFISLDPNKKSATINVTPIVVKSLQIDNTICETTFAVSNFSAGTIYLKNSSLYSIFLDRVHTYNCDFSNLLINTDISIYSFAGSLKMEHVSSKADTLKIRINGSKFSSYAFSVANKINEVDFLNDSLIELVNLSTGLLSSTKSNNDENKASFIFTNCYINCPLQVTGLPGSAVVHFHNCEFGPSASLSLVGSDVYLENCFKFAAPLYIQNFGFKNGKIKSSLITIYNTDARKLDFVYTGEFHLNTSAPNNGHYSNELIYSSFETLKSKYLQEGRSESYKNISIEFEKYKYSQQGLWGGIKNFFDDTIWLYGFARSRILLLTLGLLLIFFIANFIFKKELNKLYPVYIDTNFFLEQSNRFKYYTIIAFRIFAYTSLIFFSFQIKIDRLMQQKIGLILWILFQYVSGIICLFFILNWVLKAS
jgi:hypothetical protein